MLSLKGGSIGYRRDNVLLTDVELSLPSGAVWGLIAPNGRGKTTLMRTMAGDDRALILGSRSADGVSPLDEAEYSRLVLYAPGDDSLLDPGMSARFHLKATRRLWASPREVAEVAEELMVTPFLDVPVRRLSQGMRQQVTLAIARMAGARYTLLDEPMNALDPIKAQRASLVVARMAEEGTGVIISSHIVSKLEEFCDSVVVFRGTVPIVVRGSVDYERLFEECYGGGDVAIGCTRGRHS